MPTLLFQQPDGQRRDVTAESGISVMQAAITANIRGIDAECGGACACATCHVYLAEDWLDRVPPRAEDETDMLESVAAEARPGSRLACQIMITPELDGLAITIPDRQF